MAVQSAVPSVGLSPPARGSPEARHARHVAPRPIPARAGEPSGRSATGCSDRAYPRPRGGAIDFGQVTTGGLGLSPPARGSPNGRSALTARIGPIPARAGEPRTRPPVAALGWAYPRPRGGALVELEEVSPLRGLSPPARGSLCLPSDAGCRPRPIPARAGEPQSDSCGMTELKAYPRPRGGAFRAQSGDQLPQGLSPPARGSP